jgi:hypothetical protein
MPISQIENSALASTGLSATKLTTGTLPKAQLPTGSVLQVVQTVMSSAQSHTTLTPASVGLDVSITPTSSSNKVLILLNTFIGGAQTANEYLTVYRGATVLGGKAFSCVRIGQDAQAEYLCVPVSWSYLDSPATTSSTTYSFKVATNYLTVYVNRPYNQGGFSDVLISTITAMEIVA